MSVAQPGGASARTRRGLQLRSYVLLPLERRGQMPTNGHRHHRHRHALSPARPDAGGRDSSLALTPRAAPAPTRVLSPCVTPTQVSTGWSADFTSSPIAEPPGQGNDTTGSWHPDLASPGARPAPARPALCTLGALPRPSNPGKAAFTGDREHVAPHAGRPHKPQAGQVAN